MAYMSCADRVRAEIAKLKAVKAKRGALDDEETQALATFEAVLQWMADDKAEADRIELEAMEAEEAEEERTRKADPNYKTREMFKGVKINVPTKGR